MCQGSTTTFSHTGFFRDGDGEEFYIWHLHISFSSYFITLTQNHLMILVFLGVQRVLWLVT